MKRKILNLLIILALMLNMLIILTACGDDDNKKVINDKKTSSVNNENTFNKSYSKNLNDNKDNDYKSNNYENISNTTNADKSNENSNTTKGTTSNSEVSLETAEQVVQTAFDKAKVKSSDGNVTVKDIVDNMEGGWKLVNVNISTNSKQPSNGSKVTESSLKVKVNDERNDNNGITHLIIENEATGRQFSVGMRANSDKSIQIPAGTDITKKSYEIGE